MKIGITEAGDAALDYTWIEKAPEMDMMVLITKRITDKFIREVMRFANKTIVHATCTGYGGSVIEPNVPQYAVQLEQVKKLIAYGFPAEQIVVRIDPIIPTAKGIAWIEKIVEYVQPDIKRFRVSVIDNYPHVQERFKAMNIKPLFDGAFQASDEEFAAVDLMLSKLKFRFGVTFEACAEPRLTKAEHIGCVNNRDIQLLGLKPAVKSKKQQRGDCLCVAGKTELLPFQHVKYCGEKKCVVQPGDACNGVTCDKCDKLQIYGCSHRCAYCYWRT